MGADPARLGYWEYTALVFEWNRRQRQDGDSDPVAPPSRDLIERSFAAIPDSALKAKVH
jgi:hypothetical protein